MIYIAGFVAVILFIQLMVALANLLWGRLPSKCRHDKTPMISVLIPARNEVENIGNLLDDLRNQAYTNMEILVFDDESTDGTAAKVRTKTELDNRIRLISSDGLKSGWIGKNYGCHTLAQQATGGYYLFLDADVRIKGDGISNAVRYANRNNLGLLSVFPKQIMYSSGEWASVPVMNYILLTLLPLTLVKNSHFAALSAANGQFMLFNAPVYKTFSPHSVYRNNRVEDIAISRYLKRNMIRIASTVGDGTIRCRMYNSFAESVTGFSRNIAAYFGNSLLLAFIFWVIINLGWMLFLQKSLIQFLPMVLFILIATKIIVSIAGSQNLAKNLLYHLPQQFAFALFIFKAINSHANKSFVWKGRSIS